MAANSALRQDRAALIFGASGITGWAIAREATQYPSTDAFTRIIGLTNRPLERESARLPDDNRIQLVSGLDLTAGVSAVTSKLQAIDGIEDVTDVYFAAYIQPPGTSDIEGFEELKRVNVEILETAIHAVEAVCPQLRSWSLQTGGKAYGFVHVREIGLPKVPCKESEPRIPQPYADSVFYYAQHDTLARLSSGKRWKFVEIRPDAVTGFVPTSNAMNLAQTLGIFLSFYASEERAKNPSGTIQVPYPGPVAAYIAHHTDISQRTLAQAHLFFAGAVGNETTANGDIYNVGDTSSAGTSWAEKWARLCEYFQLEGTGPAEDGNNEPLRVGEYMRSRQDQWEKWEKDNGLQQGVIQGASWEFLDIMLGLTVFDRQYDLSKADGAGFLAKQDIVGSYFGVFDAMRGAKMIP